MPTPTGSSRLTVRLSTEFLPLPEELRPLWRISWRWLQQIAEDPLIVQYPERQIPEILRRAAEVCYGENQE